MKNGKSLLLLPLLALALCLATSCASIHSRNFFTMSDGQIARLYTLDNGRGLSVDITDLGASVVSVRTLDRAGNSVDVALGFANAVDYEENIPAFGSVVGRYANRIADGKFVLNGREYSLPVNEKRRNNTLDGGRIMNRRLWNPLVVDKSTLKFCYMSLAGEAGFPGSLYAEVVYHLTPENELTVYYRGTTDAATAVNLTNHIYFNLNGGSATDLLDHKVWSTAESITEKKKAKLTPTGRVLPVEGTPFDLRQGRTFEEILADKALPSYAIDDNFCVASQAGTMQRNVFRFLSTRTGITLTVDTDRPGVQFDMGGGLKPCCGKGGVAYRRFNGFVVEPQGWPDAVHHAEFPDSRLAPGELYESRTVYRFGVMKEPKPHWWLFWR